MAGQAGGRDSIEKWVKNRKKGCCWGGFQTRPYETRPYMGPGAGRQGQGRKCEGARYPKDKLEAIHVGVRRSVWCVEVIVGNVAVALSYVPNFSSNTSLFY